MVPPSPFLRCDPALTLDGSGISSEPALSDKEFQKAWLLHFSRSVRGHAILPDFEGEVDGSTLDEVVLPIFSGEMLFHFEEKCDCWSLDACCQRDLNALTASWYDDLAGLLRPAEEEE